MRPYGCFYKFCVLYVGVLRTIAYLLGSMYQGSWFLEAPVLKMDIDIGFYLGACSGPSTALLKHPCSAG